MMAPGMKYQSVEILLVEDNPVDVMIIKEVFHDARVCNNLHVTEDGEEATDFLSIVSRFLHGPVRAHSAVG
jgi:CheY-like chemotaxis protein